MTTGRKPTPTALRVLRGNPGKRPLPPNEPTPDAARVDLPAPDWLPDEGRAEWTRIVPLLAKNGLLTELDTVALAAYCAAFAEWREASAMIKKFGMVIKAPSGYPIPSPYGPIASKAFARMRLLLVEFGLTPSSRTRVARATPKLEPTNPLERFIRR